VREAFGVEPVLIKGSGGVFDVVVDGQGVFSKLFTGRFPEPGEVVELIRRRQAGE